MNSFINRMRGNMFRANVNAIYGVCVAIASCLAVAPLHAQNAVVSAGNDAQGSPAVATASSQPQLQQRYPRYKIQNQDALLVSFPLSPELNQTVTVQPDGYINLQTAGSLHIQGMTVPEVVDALKKAYSGILHDPIINVDLEDYQKPFFTVSGQVGKPGQYELRADISLAEGIAVERGLAATAKTQVLLFHRTSQDMFEVKKFNLKEILNGKNLDEDATLKPGDMIFVPEKAITHFRKYVPYTFNMGAYLPNTF
jgi:polysaccharide export outer membrane protein